MKNAKEPVKLRQRELRDGKMSLYLDIYYRGRRKYEYLNLYLLPGKSREVKEHNQELLAMAEAVKATRIVELRNNRFNFDTEADITLLDFIDIVMEKKKENIKHKTYVSWKTATNYLRNYTSPKTMLSDINTKWVEGFVENLASYDLSRNSILSYISVIAGLFNEAVRMDLMRKNPFDTLVLPKATPTRREYLTIEELRKLINTEFKYDNLRRMFLFSCLTGLRYSDVVRLRWGDVRKQGDMTRIVFRQHKTGGMEYLDISPQAEAYMGERKSDDMCVFRGSRAIGDVYNIRIQDWVTRAGINKKITFHCARHTFAMMMIALGVDLYVVSKLLGHKNITTTQIYAKMLDENKQAAVMMIPQI